MKHTSRKVRILISVLLLLFSSAQAWCDTIEVNTFLYAGPYTVRRPVMIDSLDVNRKEFSPMSVLSYNVNIESVRKGSEITTERLPKTSSEPQIHLIGFQMTNESYEKADITVKGMMYNQLYIDGKKSDGKNVELTPAVHEVVVKYVTTEKEQLPMWGVSVKTSSASSFSIGRIGAPRSYQLSDVLHCWRYNKVELSPSGDYVIAGYSTMQQDGKTATKTLVMNVETGDVTDQKGSASWMPASNKYYFIRQTDNKRSLVTADPVTHVEKELCADIPSGNFTISPTEDYLVFTRVNYGPKQDKDVYLVADPDDRQPNHRNKTSLEIFDLGTGLTSPLTFSSHSTQLSDISADGRKLLVTKSAMRLEKRPTTLMSVYIIDKETYAVDTLVAGDGFISSALFSPDGSQVLFTGSPEAFGGIGNVVPSGKIPSMYDYQLYLMDVAKKTVRPMTRDFNPSVQSVEWSRADGLIYFTAEDKDCINLFAMDCKSGRISRLDIPEDLVNKFSCSNGSARIALYGQSASNSDRMYMFDTKKRKAALFEDLSATTLKNIELGKCEGWNYLNGRGDTICCRYYLPPRFDAAKKYPMVVNYYGGCSPTSRNFESRYPQHVYASQGYVVLVVNPSGASGFGQEFSSRHVNTAGEGVAEDIIGATKRFVDEHQFVDSKKIGCIGASYGGFMTQYLQTKTDLFAAAISHAGISDHTSYWGEGYWGYSYSEVSMANSYPWSDRRLYVDQSPLFNADKVNTPILFLHGTDDHNVPVGESIQMFTALKLLGKPTAMVLVDGQDHHILDYQKRMKWQNTIFAWFAKYLKGDSKWWEAIYIEPNL